MGEPTNLPDFNNLTKSIARGTGRVFNPLKDTPERFLGELERNNIPVQKLASEQLSEHNLQPNNYHKHIVNLFPKSNIKIVTTNYDLMFEETCKSLDIKTNYYTNPAFPRGSDFSGIVHLHGKIGESQHMVLTDSDFGSAYMVYGEASKFLVQLFNSDYTVLFIGYSYNDTVLRYFTRALPDLSGKQRYIFSDASEKEKYEYLGMTPIIYNSGDYKNLYDSIRELGDFSNRDIKTWDERISAISSLDTGDLDVSIQGEIEHVFNEVYLLEQFLHKTNGTSWFYYLYENEYLNFIFNERELSQSEELIMNWILEKYVNENCEELITIILRNNRNLNSNFKKPLLRTISRKRVSEGALQKLLNVIKLDDLDDYVIYSLIKKLCEYNNFDKVITQLFQKLLKFEYSYTELSSELEKKNYEVKVNVHIGVISRTWELIKDKEVLLESLTDSITDELISLEGKSILGEIENNFSNFRSFLDEAGYMDDSMKYIKFFVSLFKRISTQNSIYTRHWIDRHINSKLSILRRISIYLLNYLENVSSDRKLKFINEKVGIFSLYEKEEVFSVIKNEFPKLTQTQQHDFIKIIMTHTFKNENNIESEEFKRSSEYQKFNMLVWLRRTETGNEELKESIKEIKKIYPEFKERDFPDKDISPLVVEVADQGVKISSEYFIENEIEDYFNELLDYKGDGFEKPSRPAVLRVLSKAVEEKFNLGLKIIQKLDEIEDYENDIWMYLLQGIEKHNINSSKFTQLDTIISGKITKNFTFEVAHILRKYSETITVQEYNQDKINVNSMINDVMKYSKPYGDNNELSWVDKSLNSAYGVITETIINLILLLNRERDRKDYSINEDLVTFMNRLLDSSEAKEAHTVLYMNLDQLYIMNKEWTTKRLLPNFLSEDESTFNTSWQGYLVNTYYHPETSKELKDAFLFAIEDLSKIKDDNIKEKFILVYTLMCVDIIEDPLDNYIPDLFSYSNDFVENFYRSLLYILKARDIKTKDKLWKRWLKDFVHKRIENIPTSYDINETTWILLILLEYSFIYDDVKNIIDKMKKEINSPFNVLYELTELEITEENNDTIQTVLMYCLESIHNTDKLIDPLSREQVVDILSNIHDKGYKLNEDLAEACLILNIDTSNVNGKS